MRDNREWELSLTSFDVKVLIICSILASASFVAGLVLYAMTAIFGSAFSFMLSLVVMIALLIYFVVGEINLRVTERVDRYNEINKIVHYCYPVITEKQYKQYIKLAKKGIKANKHSLMTMHFADIKNADKWLQTEEHVPLEHKWTYQLSQENGIKIRA